MIFEKAFIEMPMAHMSGNRSQIKYKRDGHIGQTM